MTKTYKSVLKSSLVMLVLFAVAGSGVAQAQECLARANAATTARAEGVTEAVGGIELLCRIARGVWLRRSHKHGNQYRTEHPGHQSNYRRRSHHR